MFATGSATDFDPIRPSDFLNFRGDNYPDIGGNPINIIAGPQSGLVISQASANSIEISVVYRRNPSLYFSLNIY